MQRCLEKRDWNYTRNLHVTFGDITVNDVNAHPSTRMSPDTDDYQEHYQNEFDSSFDDVLQIEFKINQPIEEALDQQTVKKEIFFKCINFNSEYIFWKFKTYGWADRFEVIKELPTARQFKLLKNSFVG